MKVMWLSVAPWAPTGYGQQSALTVPRIKAAGYDIAVSSTNGLQYTEIEWEGIKCFPSDRTSLNKRMLKDHVLRFGNGNADDVQVISLFDIWPWVDPQYGGMIADFKGLRMAAWVPIDSYPLPPKTQAALDMFDVRPIAMSRFGEDALRERGYDPLYVPHGVETSVYRPLDEERDAIRDSMKIDRDAFVVGMVAHNEGVQPPRKAFPQVLQAFRHFAEKHDDALLYLHTDVYGHPGGINLLELAEMFGIKGDQLAYTDHIAYQRGNIPRELMARFYNSFDVLANPSYGEGFGIPIVEAQACGTPVVVTDWTAMKELVGPGWLVGGQPWYNPSSGSNWFDPSAEEIYYAFEAAYEKRGDQQIRQDCREFALQYDVDTVFAEHWLPTLEALDKPRTVPPLIPLNREQRRAAKNLKAAA